MRSLALHSVATERSLVFAAAAVIAATIAWAAWSRHHGDTAPAPPPSAERLLRFEDLPDGRLRVTDDRTGRVVETIEGEAGFARGTLRSFMRERRRNGLGPQPPLALRVDAAGRLRLADPSTGQHIDLDAFGPANAAVFARMLPPPGEPR